MRAAFIGKTLDGHYGNGVAWTEAYLADGRLDYREGRGRQPATGISAAMCSAPSTIRRDRPALTGGCWTTIQTSANCYEFYLAGRLMIKTRESPADGCCAGMRVHGARRHPRPVRRSRASDCRPGLGHGPSFVKP